MYRKAFSILLILLTGLVILNKASFTHTHIRADGTVITHAHPFNKAASDPEGSHEHTKWEYTFFQYFDSFFPLGVIVLHALILFRVTKFLITNDNNLLSVVALISSGRAPPFFTS